MPGPLVTLLARRLAGAQLAGLACAVGWLTSACGGEAPPPPLHGAWAAVVSATEMPISLHACVATPRQLCPRGGVIERPGSSALARAQAEGSSAASFTFLACDHGQETVSGTLTTRLQQLGQKVLVTGLHGRLRVDGAATGLCDVELRHAPAEGLPLRHVGNFCGQVRELVGPSAAQLQRWAEADDPLPDPVAGAGTIRHGGARRP